MPLLTFKEITVTEPNNITKLSLNMCPRAMTAIEVAADLTGDSQTDVVNRAVQLYALHAKTVAEGGRFVVQDRDRNLRPFDLD